MIKAVFFDLDGTLLPMDQDKFTEYYLPSLVKKLAPYGYEPKKFVKAVMDGLVKMLGNDGSCTNQEAFWKHFTSVFGPESRRNEKDFLDYYANEFNDAIIMCRPTPLADELVKMVKASGRMAVLATNPIFPQVATLNRIRWAGMDVNDFDAYTTYEDVGYCKPSAGYFNYLLDKLNLKPEECIMVGNDAGEDTAAVDMGMKFFLVDTDLINRKGKDISIYPHGSLEDFRDYLKKELEIQ
ncbi:MAG: HAD family hydrolase [Thermoplasmata archaeon]|nr:HAD family hydrolase [Thermoplasmata archaeon]